MRDQILQNAFGYIEKFRGKIFVIKYGGSMLDTREISDSILDDIISFYNNDIKVVLVHGGGSAISRLMKEKGLEPKFVGGLRVTDEATVKIVDEALTNVNIDLVKRLQAKGAIAESEVSKEKLTIKGKKKQDGTCGDFMGEVSSVDIRYIKESVNSKKLPVVSPVGLDEEGRFYNINADLAAAEIAAAFSSEKFIMMTNIKGVMLEKDDESTLVSSLTKDKTHEMIDSGIIIGGMIPKVQAGMLALDKGVNKIHIISGHIKHSLLLEVFTEKGIGTEIVR